MPVKTSQYFKIKRKSLVDAIEEKLYMDKLNTKLLPIKIHVCEKLSVREQ